MQVYGAANFSPVVSKRVAPRQVALPSNEMLQQPLAFGAMSRRATIMSGIFGLGLAGIIGGLYEIVRTPTCSELVEHFKTLPDRERPIGFRCGGVSYDLSVQGKARIVEPDELAPRG